MKIFQFVTTFPGTHVHARACWSCCPGKKCAASLNSDRAESSYEGFWTSFLPCRWHSAAAAVDPAAAVVAAVVVAVAAVVVAGDVFVDVFP
jgi:hypothetical protein